MINWFRWITCLYILYILYILYNAYEDSKNIKKSSKERHLVVFIESHEMLLVTRVGRSQLLFSGQWTGSSQNRFLISFYDGENITVPNEIKIVSRKYTYTVCMYNVIECNVGVGITISIRLVKIYSRIFRLHLELFMKLLKILVNYKFFGLQC